MAEDKKGFLLYADLIHTVRKIPNEKAGELFKHILSFVNDEDPQTEDLIVQLTFEPIKQQLKRDLKKYAETKSKKSVSGREGNLKRWNEDIYKDYKDGKITLEEAEVIAINRKESHTMIVTGKQTATVSKVLTRNDEKAQTVHDQWEQIYYEQHAVEAKCLASYYKQTGYFKDLARDILAGAVPELIGYTKMSTNKYAQKVLAIHKAEPKYAAGSLVSPRANFQSSHAYFDREDTTRFSWPTANDVIEKFKARGGFI